MVDLSIVMLVYQRVSYMFSPKKLCEFSAMLNYQRAKKFLSTTVSIVSEGPSTKSKSWCPFVQIHEVLMDVEPRH